MIDERQIEKFEKENKNAIFTKIREVYSKQAETINLMSTNAKNMGQSNIDIPNVGITLNNKLVELSQTFNRAGISIFSSKLGDYNVIGSSFIGDAIIEDLIGYVAQASKKLGKYITTMENIAKKKTEQMQALEKISPIQKFFAKIKSVFISAKPVDLSLTEEEQEQLAEPAQEYRDIDDKINKYNLEDNVIPSIVKSIREQGYEAYIVPRLLEESVIPDLKKLGLERLAPQLQQVLIEEYKKDLPDPEIYKVAEEDMHLYVPYFSKEDQTDKKMMGKDLKQIHSETTSVEEESKKRSLKNDGSTLVDFSTIDKTVSANERQEGIKVIGQALETDKSNETTLGQSNDKKGEDILL